MKKEILRYLILFCSLHFNFYGELLFSEGKLEIRWHGSSRPAIIAILTLFCCSAAAGACFKETLA